jgi:hypothetical protein
MADMSETFTPRLMEEVRPKRGYFLLVPWMLIGTLWVRLNTGVNPESVSVYFSLLVAGALSLVIAAFVEPKFNAELARLKLLPFVTMFSLGLVTIFIVFTTIQMLGSGSLNHPGMNQTTWANFIAFTILIVAPVETLVFQFVIPKLTTLTLASVRMQNFGGFLSQVTFGLFHWVAYSEGGHPSAYSIVMAIFLGMGFYAVVRSSAVWGLGAAMGLHAGWNLSVMMFNATILQSVIGGWFM